MKLEIKKGKGKDECDGIFPAKAITNFSWFLNQNKDLLQLNQHTKKSRLTNADSCKKRN